jgi:hypothetical protein
VTTRLAIHDDDLPAARCASCRSFDLCAADCPIAPWNDEAPWPAPAPWRYLLRQRRWAGSPVPREDIFFVDPTLWWYRLPQAMYHHAIRRITTS